MEYKKDPPQIGWILFLRDQFSQSRDLQHDPAYPERDEQEAGIAEWVEPQGAVLREIKVPAAHGVDEDRVHQIHPEGAGRKGCRSKEG